MNVLHVIDSLGLGGKERRCVEVLKGLVARKLVKCELAIMSNEIHYPRINDINVNVHHLIRRRKRDPSIFIKLYRVCQDLKPDIIHTWESMSSIYSLPVAKLLNIKMVNGMITTAPAKLKAFGKAWIRSKLTFPFSDMVLSNSYAGLRSYNAPKRRSYCVHNGFDFSRIRQLEDPDTVKRRFRISTPRVVGMVASFTNRKDYESYVMAAKQVLRRRTDITFLAIGDGDTLEKMEDLIDPEFQSKIKVIGKQKGVESIINIFDIGVLTTNQKVHGEGISNSIMEYMALAKPVIATKGGGTSEIVADGETGFLIDPYQVSELAERVEFLNHHPHIARTMGKAGRERIRRKFNLERTTDRFIELYEHCIA